MSTEGDGQYEGVHWTSMGKPLGSVAPVGALIGAAMADALNAAAIAKARNPRKNPIMQPAVSFLRFGVGIHHRFLSLITG